MNYRIVKICVAVFNDQSISIDRRTNQKFFNDVSVLCNKTLTSLKINPFNSRECCDFKGYAKLVIDIRPFQAGGLRARHSGVRSTLR